jgi:L-asparagine transporter-like permease
MVAFLPWTEAGARVVTESPFVRMFAHSGIPWAAGVMNFVVASAALSAMNTSLYLTSRMLFSLARGGYAPAAFGRLGASGVPVRATLFSGACVVVAAGVARLTPLAYNYLFGIALFGALLVWGLILLSHLRFRRVHPGSTLEVRMPLFPWAQYLGLALLGAFVVTMGLDTEFWNIAVIVGVPWCVLVLCSYLVQRRWAGGARIS